MGTLYFMVNTPMVVREGEVIPLFVYLLQRMKQWHLTGIRQTRSFFTGTLTNTKYPSKSMMSLHLFHKLTHKSWDSAHESRAIRYCKVPDQQAFQKRTPHGTSKKGIGESRFTRPFSLELRIPFRWLPAFQRMEGASSDMLHRVDLWPSRICSPPAKVLVQRSHRQLTAIWSHHKLGGRRGWESDLEGQS